MTIRIEPLDDLLHYNYSRTPVRGQGYSCSTRRLCRYTYVRSVGYLADGSPDLRATDLREGQVKKLLRKHRIRNRNRPGGGRRPKPFQGAYYLMP